MKNKYKFKNKQGFTIAEAVVYLFVFSIIFVSFIGMFYAVNKNSKASAEEKQLQDVALFFSEHIQTSFSNASQILLPTNSGSELQLAQAAQCTASPCSTTPTVYYDYTLSSNTIVYSTGTVLPLTTIKTLSDSQYANVVSINFDLISNSKSVTTGVRATIVLRSASDTNINYTLQTNYSLL